MSRMKKTFEELLQMAKSADNDDCPAAAVECLFAAAAAAQNKQLPSWCDLILADNLRAMGRLDEAKKVLREIQEFPDNKAWLVNVHRGQVEQDAGDFQAAAHRFETSVEQNPNSTIPYVHLASAYSAMQQHEKAAELLTAGLNAEGDHDEVYLNLGYRYRALGKYRLAREAFRNALEITPDYAEAKAALRDVDSALKFSDEG